MLTSNEPLSDRYGGLILERYCLGNGGSVLDNRSSLQVDLGLYNNCALYPTELIEYPLH